MELRSSPGPETGCSDTKIAERSAERLLRSSPGPETGCSAAPVVPVPDDHRVAILTRSGDRVQRVPEQELMRHAPVLRSSPGPETGCSAGPHVP
mgnify:CR=1 FL=1